MKARFRALVAGAVICAGAAVTPAASATEAGDTQGCTPGYWKVSQHWDSWQEASPTDLFSAKFGIANDLAGIGNFSMVKALGGRGGSGAAGARQILARAAAAAYLNSAYDAPDGSAMLYPYRRDVPSTVNGTTYFALVPTVAAALSGTNRALMLDLARQLDAANNLGCPLN